MLRAPWRALGALACVPLIAGVALAQTLTPAGQDVGAAPVGSGTSFVVVDHSRIVDPKLSAGDAQLLLRVIGPRGKQVPTQVDVLRGGLVEASVFTGTLNAGFAAQLVTWDGTTTGGGYADVGDLAFRVRDTSGGAPDLILPFTVVRLGITEIEAQPTTGVPAANEWPMVYFKKNSTRTFYATPQIHEYLCTADTGDVSDLDLNDGSPRPAPAVHTTTDAPVMEGTNYEDDSYNYPLCYKVGAAPQFELTFGATCTDSLGAQAPVGYPVTGFDLRCRGVGGAGEWTSASVAITPGGTATFVGPSLSNEVQRADRTLTWSFEYRPTTGGPWKAVPGSFATTHRFYTILDEPNFGASGSTKYAGPWVEVAEYVHSWRSQLGFATADATGLTYTLIQGFFGQQGTIATAIEAVVYDAYPLGGDGGANRYYLSGSRTIDLSALLDNTAKGQYVNCSDCASSTSTMLAMLGVDNMKMIYLGYMNLNAIWGIGSPAYTTALWGPGSHAFSYHRIISRDGGGIVSDACLSVDEDGTPGSTPGIPGYNCERPWVGASGYDKLSATNTVSRTVEWLSRLK